MFTGPTVARQRDVQEHVFTGPTVARQRDVQEHVFTGPTVANRPQAAAAAPVAQPAAAGTPADQERNKNLPPSKRLVTLVTKKSKKAFIVNERFASNFQGFVDDVEKTGYNIKFIGGQRDGNKMYHHWYGGAIDINPNENPMVERKDGKIVFRSPNPGKDASHLKNSKYPFGYGTDDFTFDARALARKWGLGWGGDWSSSSDTMHFSVGKNELGTFDPSEWMKEEAGGGNQPPSNVVTSGTGIPITTGTGGFVTAPAAAPVSKPQAAATGGGKFFPVDPSEIMAFQKSVGMKGADVDGIIGPKTHRALIAAGYKEQDVSSNIRDVVAAMKRIGITDKNYIEALIGNIMKESGGKVVNEDIMGWANTDNKRIRDFFGNRVAHLSDPQLDEIKRRGREQGNFVELFTEMIYGVGSGELGKGMENTAPGDGFKYRGRGFIQLTGKKNYRMASQAIYGDDRLVKNPDLVNDPAVAAPVVAWYMKEGKDRMGRRLGYTGPLTAEQARILTTSQIAGSDIRNKGAALSTEILGKVAAYQTELAPLYSQGQTDQGPVKVIAFNNNTTVVKKPGGTQVAGNRMGLVGG